MILFFKVYLFIFFFSICENICLGCCCCAGNKNSVNESKSGGFIPNSFSEPEIITEKNFKNKNLLNNNLHNNPTYEGGNGNNINEKTLSNSKEINNQPKETDNKYNEENNNYKEINNQHKEENNKSNEENKNKNTFGGNYIKPIIDNNIKKLYSNTNVADNPLKSENANNNISFMLGNINNLNTNNLNTNVNVVNNTNNLNTNNLNTNNLNTNNLNTNVNVVNNTNNLNTNVNVVNNINKIGNIFPLVGLKNIGSTCYMNATLQCLLHVNELITYFIEEYPKDQQQLAKINNDVASGGDISRVFFNLVMGVNKNSELVMSKKNLKPKTKKKSGFNFLGFLGFDNDYDDSSYDRAFAPTDFKRTLGNHNPQFKKFEANDSKDLILYLLQTMHEELNYYGNVNKRLKYIPNQYNIYETYNHFITNYNTNNFSKISLLFYGTYQNTTTCLVCRKKLYNFQKFEFISFGLYYYHEKKFNILNGFQDNANPTVLKGDNKFLCNNCKKLQDAKTECKIFEPPLKLLINLDYGKNKKYQPSKIEFDEEIDITKFVEFDYKQKIRYRIIGVCTHYGHSGSYGHYVAFCRNTQTNTWYEFNDSFCSECNKKEIYRGSPYLLLYERIFN